MKQHLSSEYATNASSSSSSSGFSSVQSAGNNGISPAAVVDVGVRYIKASDQHPPVRIFYPAAASNELHDALPRLPVGWFQDTGIFPYLAGYLHTMGLKQDSWLFQIFVWPIIIPLFALILPVTWKRIPGVYQDIPCVKDKKLPLIVFSHGLTGTGQENSVLAKGWAQRGFVVALVHHTDGSSCRVELADGSVKYFEHSPSSPYDPEFRPKQIKIRAKDMLETYNFIAFGNCPKDIQDAVDPSIAIAAGFSYGASTAALATVMEKSFFKAALFLDGWFHIDFAESLGIEFKFPKEAFDSGVPVPSLFINSQEFVGYPKLFSATKELAAKRTVNGESLDESDIIVLPGTKHQNFIDVIFWFESGFLRRLMGVATGEADGLESFQTIVDKSSDFLVETVNKTGKKNN